MVNYQNNEKKEERGGKRKEEEEGSRKEKKKKKERRREKEKKKEERVSRFIGRMTSVLDLVTQRSQEDNQGEISVSFKIYVCNSEQKVGF